MRERVCLHFQILSGEEAAVRAIIAREIPTQRGEGVGRLNERVARLDIFITGRIRRILLCELRAIANAWQNEESEKLVYGNLIREYRAVVAGTMRVSTLAAIWILMVQPMES